MARKRTTRRRASTRGVEEQQRRRERLDARRRAREEALAAQARAQRRRRLVRSALTGLVVGFGVWLLFLQFRPVPTPDSIDGYPVQKLGESGVLEHVSGTVDYDSSPPTHGPHASAPSACGVHAEPLPNENMVHTLEHGAVGILYRPSVRIEDIRAIERIVSGFDGRVFSAPYADMDAAVTAVSWGEMMRLDSLDEEALRDYIAAFRGKGPEDTPCPATSTAEFQPEQ